MSVVLYIAGGIALFATVMVVTQLNAIHALLYLIVSFFSVALIFFFLGAPFIAALEIIIYAGAIMVLFLFVIMLLNLGPLAAEQESQWLSSRMWIGPGILSLILLGLLVYTVLHGEGSLTAKETVGPERVGVALYGPYLVGVQITAFLLLAGLIGASHLGRREKAREQESEQN